MRRRSSVAPCSRSICGRDLPIVPGSILDLEVSRQVEPGLFPHRERVAGLPSSPWTGMQLLVRRRPSANRWRIARHLHGHIKRHRPRGKAIDGFGLRERRVMRRSRRPPCRRCGCSTAVCRLRYGFGAQRLFAAVFVERARSAYRPPRTICRPRASKPDVLPTSRCRAP